MNYERMDYLNRKRILYLYRKVYITAKETKELSNKLNKAKYANNCWLPTENVIFSTAVRQKLVILYNR